MAIRAVETQNISDLTLRDYFDMNHAQLGRKITKYENYFEIYERFLGCYRGKSPRIVEIGVQHGGSLQMWRNYFGDGTTVIGVDILPACKNFERDDVKIFIGDQADPAFLDILSREIGTVDAIIDDGSHVPAHQIASFEKLFYNNLSDNGVYIVEDCHTSYWPRYGGGLKRKGTFIEYAKDVCDTVNGWHADDRRLRTRKGLGFIKSVSFFSSTVVFEKCRMNPPRTLSSGETEIDLEDPFRGHSYSKYLLSLKRIPWVQALVRRNPLLWRAMTKILFGSPKR
jgi:hypothetical protein